MLALHKEFDVVMFSHAHEDHTKGASEFFYLDHAKKYQSDSRAKIKELWVSAAFLLDTDLKNHSDAKIIRAEARHSLYLVDQADFTIQAVLSRRCVPNELQNTNVRAVLL